MPRIRTIKPEFLSDEKLAPSDVLTRFVFLGLIMMADDAGRLLDSEKLIDATLFPSTDDSAREALANLSRMGRVRRGTTSTGQRVIQITNWTKHQRVDRPNLKGAFAELVEWEGDTTIREEIARDSRDIREPLAHRPTTYDLHTNDQRPTTDDRSAAREAFLLLVSTEAPTFQETFENAFRSSRSPGALLDGFGALLNGMNGPGGKAVPMAILGQALHDIAFNGEAITAQRLRIFCEKLMRPKDPKTDGLSPGQRVYEMAKRGVA